MAYNKNTWANGDVISAEKLNNIEQGIEDASGSGGVEVINWTMTESNETITLTTTNTAAEIDAMFDDIESGSY